MESVTEERLLRRVHTIAIVVVSALFVLVIGIVCQFAAVNYNKHRQQEVQALIALREQQAKELERNKDYYNSDEFRRDWLADAGYTEDGAKQKTAGQ